MSAKIKKGSFFKKLTGFKDDNDETQDETQDAETETEENNDNVSVQTASTAGGAGDKDEWLDKNYEGQLSVDVYQTSDEIVIKSAVAGVSPEDLDISITNDMITIRGQRQQEEDVAAENYFYQECYWGSFSRSIILPMEVKAESAEASFKNGILTIRLPKAKKSKKISIKVVEE